jgi:hypothetical protein
MPVIVMELLNGGELFQKLDSRHRAGLQISEIEAAEIFEGLCTTFSQIHGRRIIVRDFKTENCVFVHSDPSRLECKVIDLGSATRLPDGEDHLVDHRTECEGVGTVSYLAPESVDEGIYSAESDVWQLGVLLFTMVYAAPPFQVAGPAGREYHIRNEDGSFKTHFDDTGRFFWDTDESRRSGDSRRSDHLCDLITRIFKPAAERISISGILEHPWVTQRRTAEFKAAASTLGPVYMQRVRGLRMRHVFNRVMGQCVTRGQLQRDRLHACLPRPVCLSAGDFKELRAQFMVVAGVGDDGSGQGMRELCQEDFSCILEKCGLHDLANTEVFGIFDVDGGGTVDYSEFVLALAALRSPPPPPPPPPPPGDGVAASSIAVTMMPLPPGGGAASSDLEEGDVFMNPRFIFDMLDINGDGNVTLGEMRKGLSMLLSTVAEAGARAEAGAGAGAGTGTGVGASSSAVAPPLYPGAVAAAGRGTGALSGGSGGGWASGGAVPSRAELEQHIGELFSAMDVVAARPGQVTFAEFKQFIDSNSAAPGSWSMLSVLRSATSAASCGRGLSAGASGGSSWGGGGGGSWGGGGF